MRRAAIGVCLLVFCAAVGMPLIDYVGGLRGFPLSIFMVPAEAVPMFTGFTGVVGLIVLLAASIHEKRRSGRYPSAWACHCFSTLEAVESTGSGPFSTVLPSE